MAKTLPKNIKISDTEAVVSTLDTLQKTFDRLVLDSSINLIKVNRVH